MSFSSLHPLCELLGTPLGRLGTSVFSPAWAEAQVNGYKPWVYSGVPCLIGVLALSDQATRHTLSSPTPFPRPHLACVHGVYVFHRLQAFRLRIFDLTFQAFYFKLEQTSLATTHQLPQAVSFKHKQDRDSCQREDNLSHKGSRVHSLEGSGAQVSL